MSSITQNNIEQQKQSVLALIKTNLMGNKNLSVSGLAQLCEVADTSIIRGSAFKSQKLAEMLTTHGFTAKVLIEKGFNAEATYLVLRYFAFESKVKSTKAYNLCVEYGIKPNRKKKTRKSSMSQEEEKIRNKFFAEGDKREVTTSLGRIDLVTPTHIVEFKRSSACLHALGQVLGYHTSLGQIHLKPAIILFGKISQSKLLELFRVTALSGVSLHHFDESEESFEYIFKAIHSYKLSPWTAENALRASEMVEI